MGGNCRKLQRRTLHGAALNQNKEHELSILWNLRQSNSLAYLLACFVIEKFRVRAIE